MTDSDPLLPRIASDSTFSSYSSEPSSPYPRAFSDSPTGDAAPPSRKQLGVFASASSVCMVFLAMMVHGIFSGQIPHWQAVMSLDELQVGVVEYVFFGCVTLGVVLLFLLRHLEYSAVLPAMLCAVVVAVVAGMLLNPNPTLSMIIWCRAFNGLAAGVAMASVTPDLIAPVLLFSSTSVLVGSSLSSLFFEIFNSGPALKASLDSTPTLILLITPVFIAALSFIFFLAWFVRYFVGPLCPPADDRSASAAQQPEPSPHFGISRLLHAASALTQGVVIGTILSTFPVLQTLDAAFFRPIGICHNAYLVIIMGKVAAQPASTMLSRAHPCHTAAAGCVCVAGGFWLLTGATHALTVVMALFGMGAGSSLLAFPSAALYSHERCSSTARAHFTPVVVEFIGVYFLGVASVSCLASLKFSGIVVGNNAENSTAADVDFFLRVAGCLCIFVAALYLIKSRAAPAKSC